MATLSFRTPTFPRGIGVGSMIEGGHGTRRQTDHQKYFQLPEEEDYSSWYGRNIDDCPDRILNINYL